MIYHVLYQPQVLIGELPQKRLPGVAPPAGVICCCLPLSQEHHHASSSTVPPMVRGCYRPGPSDRAQFDQLRKRGPLAVPTGFQGRAARAKPPSPA